MMCDERVVLEVRVKREAEYSSTVVDLVMKDYSWRRRFRNHQAHLFWARSSVLESQTIMTKKKCASEMSRRMKVTADLALAFAIRHQGRKAAVIVGLLW